MNRRRRLFAIVGGGAVVVGLLAGWISRPDAAARPSLDAAPSSGAEASLSFDPRDASPDSRAPNAVDRAPFVDVPPPLATPLQEGLRRLRFRVVYDDGAPLARETIFVEAASEDRTSASWSAIDEDSLRATLDADGYGEVTTPRGARVRLRNPSTPTRYPKFEVEIAPPLNDDVAVVVTPARRVVSIAVVDELGRPAADLWFSVWARRPGLEFGHVLTSTDASGRIVIRDAPDGGFVLRTTNPTGGEAEFEPIAAEGDARLDEPNVVVEGSASAATRILVRRFQRVVGRWIVADGVSNDDPSTYVALTVAGCVEPVSIGVETAADGRFRGVVRRDDSFLSRDATILRASAECWFSDSAATSRATVETPPSDGGDIDFGDVRVDAPKPNVRLRCVDDRGEPVLDVRARPLQRHDLAWRQNSSWPIERALDDPSIVLLAVAEDVGELWVGAEGHRPAVVKRSVGVDDVLVAVLDRNARLLVRFSGREGRTLDCGLTSSDRGRSSLGDSFQTVEDGPVELEPPEPRVRPILVVREAREGRDRPTSGDEILAVDLPPFAPGERRETTIELPKRAAGTVAGRVTTHDGSPVEGLYVAFECEASVIGASSAKKFHDGERTGPDGRYEIRLMRRGEAIVRCRDGLLATSRRVDWDGATRVVDLVLPKPRTIAVEVRLSDEPDAAKAIKVAASVDDISELLTESTTIDDGDSRIVRFETLVPKDAIAQFFVWPWGEGARFDRVVGKGEAVVRIDVVDVGRVLFEPARGPVFLERLFQCRSSSDPNRGAFIMSVKVAHGPTPRAADATLRSGRYELVPDGEGARIEFEVRAGETTRVVLPR
jgi:hypothetical protein